MVFDEERILSVRVMILSKTKEDRAIALDKLVPHQKKDFIEILNDNLKYVNRNNWLKQVKKLKNKYPFIYTTTKELKTQEVICEINRQLVELK